MHGYVDETRQKEEDEENELLYGGYEDEETYIEVMESKKHNKHNRVTWWCISIYISIYVYSVYNVFV